MDKRIIESETGSGEFERDYRKLEENYLSVISRIRDAEKISGRPEGSVTLIPAVKYADADQIGFLYKYCDLREIGENRVQTMMTHMERLGGLTELKVHIIGSLQANKAKYVAGRVALIHSLDSIKLAEEINRQCEKRGAVQDVLVEINSGREQSKGGVEPEQAAELCSSIAGLENISLRGFMTMGPAGLTEDEYYNIFSKTYSLSLDIWKKILHNIKEPIFSMGMTDSLEPAIAAGATHVRVGRAIFGGRPVVDGANKL